MFYKSYRLILFLFLPVSLSAAIQTRTIRNQGTLVVSYDYDDVTNKVQLFRVINNSSDNYCGQFRKVGNTVWAAQIFLANSGNTTIAVPQSGVNSIVLNFGSKGQPDNVQGNEMYPYPHAALNPDTANPCADY